MRFARLDHIVLQVPEIRRAHLALLALGFEEAWPIGRNWPHGPTSGIALGGINLELLQPDEEAPARPGLAEIVLAPRAGADLGAIGSVVEKIESDPDRLAARGFPPEMRAEPQRICTNAFPGGDAPWPHFACDYAPFLARSLAGDRYRAPFGPVVAVEIGPLVVRPRFVAPPLAPGLDRFLAAMELEEGPRLEPGIDRIRFEDRVLDLASLTILS